MLAFKPRRSSATRTLLPTTLGIVSGASAAVSLGVTSLVGHVSSSLTTPKSTTSEALAAPGDGVLEADHPGAVKDLEPTSATGVVTSESVEALRLRGVLCVLQTFAHEIRKLSGRGCWFGLGWLWCSRWWALNLLVGSGRRVPAI